jgi:hypothetical protein
MTPVDRAMFIAAYSRLVADVWADPVKERALDLEPRGFLAEYGLQLPGDVGVQVVRDATETDPDLQVQVDAWDRAPAAGVFVVFVPALQPVAEAELAEDELDSVVAGLDSSCACCCPCCCT